MKAIQAVGNINNQHNAPGEMLKLRLFRAIRRTFNKIKLHLMFSILQTVTPKLKDKLSDLDTTSCIY